MKKYFYHIVAVSIFFIGFSAVTFAQMTAEQYLQSAIRKQTTRDFKGAIGDYTKVIELKSYDSEAYLNRGNCQFQLGEVDAAILDFTKTIELNPKNVKAFYSRAVSYSRQKKYRQALRDADRVVELDPSTSGCLTLRGQLRSMTGNKKGGCEDLNLAKNNGDKNADKFLAQFCAPLKSTGEKLQLNWPKEEQWSFGEIQENGQIQVQDLVRSQIGGVGWREVANMTTIIGAKNIKVDTAMNMMYLQAKLKSNVAKLTFIEKDEKAEFPWILFTIEVSKFTNNMPPESQLWYIVQGKESLYTNFRALKKPKIPADLKAKWAKFFKTGKIVRK
ncbi:MAG: tetratricopeptide repeat protein [Ignavibacteria bacterium]|nr:tetratricopeptide repeat protein [Ignavibacteria bacterium]